MTTSARQQAKDLLIRHLEHASGEVVDRDEVGQIVDLIIAAVGEDLTQITIETPRCFVSPDDKNPLF